jgi:hypothetical protein
MKIALFALALLVLWTHAAAAGTVGFQRVVVPDSDNKPREVGVWYPSDAAAST